MSQKKIFESLSIPNLQKQTEKRKLISLKTMYFFMNLIFWMKILKNGAYLLISIQKILKGVENKEGCMRVK